MSACAHTTYHPSNNSEPLIVVLKSDLNHHQHPHHSLCCHPQMEFRLVTVVLMAIMTMTTLLALCVTETEARPSRSIAGMSDGWAEYYRTLGGMDEHRRSIADPNECVTSAEVRELCQRCAKATKSRWAYPLCCEKQKDARKFCHSFINFGFSSRNDLSS